MGPYNKFSKILKKMKSADFIYSVVFFTIILMVVILFNYSVNFIVKNIDQIFFPDQAADTPALDMGKYSLVIKKLGLPVNTTQENATIPNEVPVVNAVTPAATAPAAETPAPATETPTPAPTLDKKSITINILNTTSKKGVAAALAKALENAGFAKAVTGNEKKSYALTTIIIKDEKKDYLPLLEEAVKLSYPRAVTETVTGKTDFDVTIMIGAQ